MNARAKVAGALMRKTDKLQLSRIGVFIWAWPDGPATMPQRLAALTEAGFSLTARYTLPVRSVDEVEKQRAQWLTSRSRLPLMALSFVLRMNHRVSAGYPEKGTG
jgi:DNA ligase (NAD+)